MTTSTILVLVRTIARAAVGVPSVRATLLALSIVLGLGGCAASHGRTPEGSPARVVDAGTPDAEPPPPFPIGVPADPDVDGDGYRASVDCNDRDATVHPGAVEDPCRLDEVDQNCDGWDLDEECESDPDCLMWLCNG